MDEIVATFVVLGIFVVVASLLSLYVWRVDPQQFAVWTTALRPRHDQEDQSTPKA